MSKIKIGKIDTAIVHYIGSLNLKEGVRFSDEPTDIEMISKGLIRNIEASFKREDLYKFNMSSENQVYSIVSNIFTDSTTLLKNSKLLAKILYEKGYTNKIKTGNLWVLLLRNVIYDGTTTSAIALLKAETKEKRLIYIPTENSFRIQEVETYSLKKFDKGCVIINALKEEGFVISTFVNSKTGYDEKYWNYDFLNLASCQSPFQQTRTFIRLCQNFIKGKLQDLEKKDRSLLFAKIKTTLKSADTISIDNFAISTFNQDTANEFLSYFKTQNKNLQIHDTIQIDSKELQKKKAFTPQTIHLDSNFDITIFGGEGFLMKGVDASNGMSYYKLYFRSEH